MVLRETHTAKREAMAKLYTCYAWPVRPSEETALGTYADVLLGIHRSEVVTAYDNLSWRREEDDERAHEARQGLPSTPGHGSSSTEPPPGHGRT
jgi:hypothetical protein